MNYNKKDIRKNFRKEVFERDNCTCQICGTIMSFEPEKYFDSHHITDRSEMPNGGYVKENGITVCRDNSFINISTGKFTDSCHMKCEKYHISNGEDWEENLHPNDLYRLIGSSYDIAYKKSKELW